MSKYVSVRVSAADYNRAAGQAHHDLRNGFVPGYIDRERTADNSVVIPPASNDELRSVCILRRSQRETRRVMKSNASVAVVGIITFSREAQSVIESLGRDEQDARFLDAATSVAEALGTNLTGLVVHRDEQAIHCHFQCPAYRHDGKTVAQEIGRDGASKIQDIVAESFDDLGITRGEKKHEKIQRLRGAGVGEDEITAAVVHRSVRRLHEDLPEEVRKKESELQMYQGAAARAAESLAKVNYDLDEKRRELQDAQAKIEKNERLLREQQEKLDAGRVSEEKAKKRLEIYEQRAAAAREEESKLLSSIESARAVVTDLEASREKAKKGILDAISFSKNFFALGAAVDDLLEHGAVDNSGRLVSGKAAIEYFLKHPDLLSGTRMQKDDRLNKVLELSRLTFPERPDGALRLCVGDVKERVSGYRGVVEEKLSVPNQAVAALEASERQSLRKSRGLEL